MAESGWPHEDRGYAALHPHCGSSVLDQCERGLNRSKVTSEINTCNNWPLVLLLTVSHGADFYFNCNLWVARQSANFLEIFAMLFSEEGK